MLLKCSWRWEIQTPKRSEKRWCHIARKPSNLTYTQCSVHLMLKLSLPRCWTFKTLNHRAWPHQSNQVPSLPWAWCTHPKEPKEDLTPHHTSTRDTPLEFAQEVVIGLYRGTNKDIVYMRGLQNPTKMVNFPITGRSLWCPKCNLLWSLCKHHSHIEIGDKPTPNGTAKY